ncbi:MAG: DUF3343 domain-containing protein [Dehalococcoidia bacterium]|nr:DUF3343 domain-containing protein [Dehalococcoidia bacterium]
MNNAEIKRWAYHGDSIIIFTEPYETIRANKLLQSFGLDAKIVSPHPKLRMGCCALGLEISLTQKADIELLFKNHDIGYHQIIENHAMGHGS